MSGFSPEWLALREAADHAARNRTVGRAVQRRFGTMDRITIVDLGCGAGSNLRGTFDLYPKRQSWHLVDNDRDLLSAARAALSSWADTVSSAGGRLVLGKAGRALEVTFHEVDLARDVDRVLAAAPDVVSAAALFDLCSAEFIARFAASIARRRLALYTVLTYDGRDHFDPPDPLDGAMLAAFQADMGRDKGFGPAAGPRAADHLQRALEERGYRITSGDSPWVLEAADPLCVALARGFSDAVAATGRVEADQIERWLALRLARGSWETGHTDLFAVPS